MMDQHGPDRFLCLLYQAHSLSDAQRLAKLAANILGSQRILSVIENQRDLSENILRF